MKWENKSHELDLVADKLLQKADKYKYVYLFGAGKIGISLRAVLCAYGIFEGFIDNDIHKQGQFKGYKVYSLEEYLKKPNGIIVVAVGEKIIPEILRQLEDVHLSKGKDFFLYTEFYNTIFPVLSVYLFDKSFINLAQISLTERCTLRCKKCAHGCFAVDNSTTKDLTLEQVKKSVDSFFSKVDFVQEFVLIGGEPILYRHLSDVVEYIGSRYRKQIGIYSITTNGTIVPDEKMLKACRDNEVMFHISNYSKTIPGLANMYKKLTDVLKNYGISYNLDKEEHEWMDYGFDHVDRNASEEELIRVFDSCKTPCREVRENRFYFCVMARSVAENMGFHVGENDYLDLDALPGDKGKKELLEFTLGYSEKGYLDMCNYCYGADMVKYPIPVAEQEEKAY